MTGLAFSATVSTLKAVGLVKRLATEKTSKGPQKSSTSTSSKTKITRVRVWNMVNTWASSPLTEPTTAGPYSFNR